MPSPYSWRWPCGDNSLTRLKINLPIVELVGITTVGGNVTVARSTRNTLALLDYAGREEVPVAQGAAKPLQGRYGYSHKFHGNSGLSRRLPNPTSRPVDEPALDFLEEKLLAQPGEINLVALGPLTNLALLHIRNPDALKQAASVVVMGGSVQGRGNVTPYAEFNFYSDPVAANTVLRSGVQLTLVDLWACRQVYISKNEANYLRSSTRNGNLATQILINWFAKDAEREPVRVL